MTGIPDDESTESAVLGGTATALDVGPGAPKDDGEPPEAGAHGHKAALVGASVAALAALLLVYLSTSFLARQVSGPDEVQQYVFDPGVSHSLSASAASPSPSASPLQPTDVSPSVAAIPPPTAIPTKQAPQASSPAPPRPVNTASAPTTTRRTARVPLPPQQTVLRCNAETCWYDTH